MILGLRRVAPAWIGLCAAVGLSTALLARISLPAWPAALPLAAELAVGARLLEGEWLAGLPAGVSPAQASCLWLFERPRRIAFDLASAPLEPDLLVYLDSSTVASPRSSRLPPGVRLLGPIAAFREPQTLEAQGGRVLLYSLAHSRLVAEFRLPLPPESSSASPR